MPSGAWFDTGNGLGKENRSRLVLKKLREAEGVVA